MERACILGSSGFVGSNLVRRIGTEAIDLLTPVRGERLAGRALGTVFYCIGLTADFRTRPFDTVQAHVCLLREILETCNFEALVYLSSARVYAGAAVASETADLRVNPTRPGDLYNLSKLMGESLCLSCGRANVRVARLSNVLGKDVWSENFLSEVIRDAVRDRRVVLRTGLDSEKDYILVEDVVEILYRIGRAGRAPIYNVASGTNLKNREILDEVRRKTGCEVEVAASAPDIVFPPIDTTRVRAEFGHEPRPVLPSIAGLIDLFAPELSLR